MHTRSLRDRKKERTRQALQDAALQLFDERGYESTTIDDIAAAADVSPRTFFRYFGSKEEVCTWDPYDPVMFDLLARRPPHESPVTAMRAVLATMMGSLSQEEQRTILARVRLFFSTPALRAQIFDGMQQTEEALAAVLAERAGVPADDLKARVMAAAIIGALAVSLGAWHRGEGRESLAEVFDRSLAHLETGLRGSPHGDPAHA